jgi:predicted extracellular nuclease
MALMPAPLAHAAAPSELFFSEYIEGTSNNKALEIYNGTSAPIDLAAGGYNVFMSFNGGTSTLTINLTGTVASGDVFVLAQASASPAILAQADQTSSAGWFNGDDAVLLRKGTTVIDAIGQLGFDPGTEWGSGLTSTADNTLRRKADICAGDTDSSNPFDPSIEWDGYATDTFDGLGTHTANCGASALEPKINEFSASTVGTDVEYVEVFGTPATDYSAYTILEIEGDSGTAAGTIDEVISLGTTDANGLYLVNLPANALENGSLTLLLVKNFSGALNTDLDTNDDGVFDTTPWDTITDAVAVHDGGSGDLTYGLPVLGVSYDGLPFAPGGASRIPDGFDTDSATDWVRNDFDLAGIPGFPGTPILGEAYNTPGAPNQVYTLPPEACGDPFTPIYTVQGSGLTSPLAGNEVAVEGIVVGDFQNNASPDNGNLNGFYIQDPLGDGNPATSDGIFIYAPGGMDVATGDSVRVRGAVSEFNGLTEITASQIWLCGTGASIAPTPISLPVATPNDFEAYEGMLVTFPQPLIISEYFNFDRFGEIVLTSRRHLTPTAEFEPGSPEQAQAEQDYLLDSITLDDGRTTQNPDPAIHPNGGIFDLTNLFRGGDTLTNVTGVMDYSFNLYRIQPTQGADYTPTNPRPAAPEAVGGRLRVASMNTLNFFLTLDYPSGDPRDNKCGPLQNVECRGADADQPTEFTRQRAKLLAALAGLNADIIGLNELENTTGVDPLGDPTNGIVAGLNDIFGAGTYAYINTGVIGTDAIRVGIIYKPSKVTPVGAFKILDSSVDPRFLDTKSRPSLAQTFEEVGSGARFTVVVNHFKSKGSACNDVGDPDTGDGQGNCNLTRTAAAQALVDWLATDPTGSGDADFLIIGDLNSYDKEDPIDAIKAGADDTPGSGDDYTDLAFHFQGEDAYSYVFNGQIGYLDYALASHSLLRQVTGMTDWHINADEPDLIDYDTSFKLPAQDALYAPDPYRASDHDPVLIGLNLEAPFPATALLDAFNRPNGTLGSNWKGATGSYRIAGNQVDVRRDGAIYWKTPFGTSQEVFVTLTNIDPAGFEQDLLLKAQGQYGPNWGEGVIELQYHAASNTVELWTFRPDTLTWYSYGSLPLTFANGDQFGTRALSDGTVIVYKNGVEAGYFTLNAADQAFFNPKGGYIGLWFINASNAFFDNFGGGTLLP